MLSRVLINESPLLVLPSLATEIGLNEAIILQQIHYWLMNKSNKNIYEEKLWVRNTYEQWGAQFPFWGKNTIVRTIDNLHDRNLIISFKAQNGFRNQKYYTIDYDVLNAIVELMSPHTTINLSSVAPANFDKNCTVDLPKMGRPMNQIASKSDTHHPNKIPKTKAESALGYQTNNLKEESPTQNGYVDLPKMGRSSSEFSPTGNSSIYRGTSSELPISEQFHERNSTEPEISGSPTTQGGLIDLPNLGRPYTQNGYAEIPNLGKSYTEAENNFKNIIPPLTPPNSKSVEDEEELSVRMIRVWNQLVQSKIKDAARKELVLTEARRQALGGLFEGVLNRDFAEWERYCEQISHIRFLLGHGPRGFKVSLDWATEPDNALKVLEGRIYDRPVETDAVEEKPHNELASEIQELFATKGFSEEWLPIYLFLAERQGQAFYRSWLKACEPQPVVDGKGVLFASTTFARDHMTSQYLSDIQQAARHFWKQNVEIIIEVKK